MWKAFRLARKYSHLIDDIIDFIVLVQTTGKDGKLTKQERGKLISASSKLIRQIRQANIPS